MAGLIEQYMAEKTGCVPARAGNPPAASKFGNPPAGGKFGNLAAGGRNTVLRSPGGNRLVLGGDEKGLPCRQIPPVELELRFQQDPKVKR